MPVPQMTKLSMGMRYDGFPLGGRRNRGGFQPTRNAKRAENLAIDFTNSATKTGSKLSAPSHTAVEILVFSYEF